MNKKKKISIIIILGIIAILSFLAISFYIKQNSLTNNNAMIANPASVYCKENNGTLEIRTNELGQYGICIKNENECEEWAFFRGECNLWKNSYSY